MKRISKILVGLLGLVLLAGGWWAAGKLTSQRAPTRSSPEAQTAKSSPPSHSRGSKASSLAAPLPTRSPSARRRGTAASLPPELVALLDPPWQKPDPKKLMTLPLLTPEQEQILLDRYRQAPLLTNRVAYVAVLGWRGDFEAARALWHTLTGEFSNHALPVEEEEVLTATIPWYLGNLAQRHAKVLDFLARGARESFWNTSLPCRNEAGRLSGTIASSCLLALGWSGQAKALAMLRQVGDEQLRRTGRAHGVVDAAFLHAMARQYGERWAVISRGDNDQATIEKTMHYFGRWSDGEDGRWWHSHYFKPQRGQR